MKDNNSFSYANIITDTLITKLLQQNPQLFNQVLSQKDELGIQLLYTQIDRDKKNKEDKIKFIDHSYNLNQDQYFYPASTVKLPVAILALQKLNELKVAGLDKNTTMITGSAGGQQTGVMNDASAADGRPTIAHYIKKILLVSDNDAFNRLYEFLGQEYINNSLHKMGFSEAQIIHRLSISLSDEENRHTNPIRFIDKAGNIIYEKPAEISKLVYAERNTKMGKGFMRGAELVNEPFDFSKKNRLLLTDLHQMIKSILFPQAVGKEQRFNLTDNDYNFLRLYMSMRPGESKTPAYDTTEHYDNYVKMIYYGSEKTSPDPDIRIFNKTGTAYGFLIDACYFVDFKNNIEFILSAVIYCNSDGIFNDDKYDYKTIGYPFLKNLGRVIYAYELKRKRKYPANLSLVQFNYKN
ncbi:hypothetical protein CAP36_01905 [Chitinophagaceae bacterium IBVUCB2]|nr:hypothetical protein CAP36_01905 [Chitinophagaceae bacterium IBVUCB2]